MANISGGRAFGERLRTTFRTWRGGSYRVDPLAEQSTCWRYLQHNEFDSYRTQPVPVQRLLCIIKSGRLPSTRGISPRLMGNRAGKCTAADRRLVDGPMASKLCRKVICCRLGHATAESSDGEHAAIQFNRMTGLVRFFMTVTFVFVLQELRPLLA